MKDFTAMIERTAQVWVDLGGDSDDFGWMSQAIKNKIEEMTGDEDKETPTG